MNNEKVDLKNYNKKKGKRYPTHTESIPHTNCIDPKHCDCHCFACMEAHEHYLWTEAGCPV